MEDDKVTFDRKNGGKKVTAIIPAFNEAPYIEATVRAVRSVPEVDEVIVVDDGSSDNTAGLAERAGARVIRQPNAGKGAAMNRGIAEATGDVLLFLDGDLGSTAAEGRRLLLPVLDGEAEMTVARFPRARKKGGFGLVKGLARWGIRRFTGLVVDAPLSGQRAVTRQLIEAVGGLAQGYGVEVGLTIDAARRGFIVKEVATQMTHAETGRDLAGFMHRGRQLVHVARVLAGRLRG